jgi:hypothetical protein
METREFGEKRIIELMSNESEYGDDERALFRLCRKLLGRGLVSLELAEKIIFILVDRSLTKLMSTVRLTTASCIKLWLW